MKMYKMLFTLLFGLIVFSGCQNFTPFDEDKDDIQENNGIIGDWKVTGVWQNNGVNYINGVVLHEFTSVSTNLKGGLDIRDDKDYGFNFSGIQNSYLYYPSTGLFDTVVTTQFYGDAGNWSTLNDDMIRISSENGKVFDYEIVELTKNNLTLHLDLDSTNTFKGIIFREEVDIYFQFEK